VFRKNLCVENEKKPKRKQRKNTQKEEKRKKNDEIKGFRIGGFIFLGTFSYDLTW